VKQSAPQPNLKNALVLYEYPFNEGIRTMLRLEHLFDRMAGLIARDDPVDHHYALASMFEIMDVAARADLKSDVLKELDRHKTQLQGYRGNPAISEAVLDEVIGRVDGAFKDLNESPGKAGQALTANEWLMSIRSRIGIPGGTCAFDLPAYYAWQQYPAAQRRADLMRWTDTLAPLSVALHVLLGLLRESGVPHKVVANGGQYQQSLPTARTYHLLRVKLPKSADLVPEITGHRLMVSIRLMKADAEGRLRPLAEDCAFELALCA
jgi:cell division protein ZapD